MKRIMLIIAALSVITAATAQERLNDTVINGQRWVKDKTRWQTDVYYQSFPFDEHESIIDLNMRLRKTAKLAASSVGCGIAGATCVAIYLNTKSKKALYFGSALVGIGGILGMISIVPMLTDRLYVNQDGLVFKIKGPAKKHPTTD